MSERGRGSGPDERDLDGDEAVPERDAGEFASRPPAARPIAPYDPYRPRGGDASRLPTRNVAADPLQPPYRSGRRPADRDPFLPDDDPLNAEAWQLELDETVVAEERDDATLPDFDLETPVRSGRARRQPAATRNREAAAGTERRPRRARAATTGARTRAMRPTVTIGVPRVVAGSPLFADQTAIMLLGIGVASIVIMALLLGVRMGGIPSPAVLHLDAAGNPDRWGAPSVLWRLPLAAFFLTVMSVVIAWFLYPIDRFAARFALAAAVVAQVIAWVAVIQHLG
jgi:hypothetical protein